FGVAANILTVRLLSKNDFGVYSFANVCLRYASIFCLFTLDAALLRYIPEYRARGDRRGLINVLKKALGINVSAWILSVIVVALLSGWLSQVSKADIRLLLFTGALVIMPSVVSVSLQAVLTSFFEVKIQAIGTVIGGCLQLFLIWYLIKGVGWGGTGAMVAQVGMSGFLLILFALKIRHLPLPEQTSEYIPFRIRRLILFSLPYVINTIAGTVFLRQSEVLFLQPYWGGVAVATYTYSYQLAQRFLDFVPTVLYGVGNVLASTAFVEGREQLAKVMGIYMRITAVTITAVSVGGFVLADKLAVLFYGAKAADSGQIAMILFISQAVIIFVNPYNFVMRAEEKTWLSFWLSPPAAMISLGIDWLLIPKYGVQGALLATSLSFFLVTLLQYRVFRWAFPYLDVPWVYVARCYAASLPMLLVIPLKGLVSGHFGLLIGLIAALALWIFGARTMRLVGESEADLLLRSGLPGSRLLLKALAR
ncbi:MAG: oligosaccharide flippase family protein, partial [Armatimonadota bacterium]